MNSYIMKVNERMEVIYVNFVEMLGAYLGAAKLRVQVSLSCVECIGLKCKKT